jgi:hypothetical protein
MNPARNPMSGTGRRGRLYLPLLIFAVLAVPKAGAGRAVPIAPLPGDELAEEGRPAVADRVDVWREKRLELHRRRLRAQEIAAPDRRSSTDRIFFWTAWACGTERPGAREAPTIAAISPAATYTNNWPAEPLIDNRPTGSIIVWLRFGLE